MNLKQYWEDWDESSIPPNIMWLISEKFNTFSQAAKDLIFTKNILNGDAVYTHATHSFHSMPETMAHHILRSSKTSKWFIKLNFFTKFYEHFLFLPANFSIEYVNIFLLSYNLKITIFT